MFLLSVCPSFQKFQGLGGNEASLTFWWFSLRLPNKTFTGRSELGRCARAGKKRWNGGDEESLTFGGFPCGFPTKHLKEAQSWGDSMLMMCKGREEKVEGRRAYMHKLSMHTSYLHLRLKQVSGYIELLIVSGLSTLVPHTMVCPLTAKGRTHCQKKASHQKKIICTNS